MRRKNEKREVEGSKESVGMAGKKAAADIRMGSSGDQFAVFAAVPRIGASSKQYLAYPPLASSIKQTRSY